MTGTIPGVGDTAVHKTGNIHSCPLETDNTWDGGGQESRRQSINQ